MGVGGLGRGEHAPCRSIDIIQYKCTVLERAGAEGGWGSGEGGGVEEVITQEQLHLKSEREGTDNSYLY